MILCAFQFPALRDHNHSDLYTLTAESALRAGPDANPPLNMRNALIFHATIICVVSVLVFGLKGKQTRRERDEIEARRAENPPANLPLPGEVEKSKGSDAT